AARGAVLPLDRRRVRLLHRDGGGLRGDARQALARPPGGRPGRLTARAARGGYAERLAADRPPGLLPSPRDPGLGVAPAPAAGRPGCRYGRDPRGRQRRPQVSPGADEYDGRDARAMGVNPMESAQSCSDPVPFVQPDWGQSDPTALEPPDGSRI